MKNASGRHVNVAVDSVVVISVDDIAFLTSLGRGN